MYWAQVRCSRNTVYAHISEGEQIPWWGTFSLSEQIPSYTGIFRRVTRNVLH